jgi:hypothetical protein
VLCVGACWLAIMTATIDPRMPGGIAIRHRLAGVGGILLDSDLSICDNPPRKIPYYRLKPIVDGVFWCT